MEIVAPNTPLERPLTIAAWLRHSSQWLLLFRPYGLPVFLIELAQSNVLKHSPDTVKLLDCLELKESRYAWQLAEVDTHA